MGHDPIAEIINKLQFPTRFTDQNQIQDGLGSWFGSKPDFSGLSTTSFIFWKYLMVHSLDLGDVGGVRKLRQNSTLFPEIGFGKFGL